MIAANFDGKYGAIRLGNVDHAPLRCPALMREFAGKYSANRICRRLTGSQLRSSCPTGIRENRIAGPLAEFRGDARLVSEVPDV